MTAKKTSATSGASSKQDAGAQEETTARRKEGTKAEDAPLREAFPVVGIGASAGGLEALREFFDHMPDNTGLAFVVVTHQHPGHTSMLPELLSRNTKMPVTSVKDGTDLEPDHVYVSAGAPITLEGNILREHEPEDRGKPTLPIDLLFRSLAESRRTRAICIVLSGTGADGTIGLKAVKGLGGMAMVQEAKSARYQGMPTSAIATSQADYILPVADMPARLTAYCDNLALRRPAQDEQEENKAESLRYIQEALRRLRLRTGHDFSEYKVSTLRRRIERRMNVHQISDLETYVRFLSGNPQEIDILFKEFLIGVTSFFRDRPAFDSLAHGPLRELLANRPEGATLRAWVVGCGSGEEAYSLAILLRETADALNKHFQFQIFSTDLDHDSIETARAGRYPAGIANDVPADTLERWFDKEDSMYRIRKQIRDMVVFAPQNVISDPPFTKLDLISCRNVLIYMNGDLQKRVLPLLHYALKADGLLLLGPSETIGTHADSFETLDKKNKIYRRRASSKSTLPELIAREDRQGELKQTASTHEMKTAVQEARLSQRARDLLIDRFAPPSVIVNGEGMVLFVQGRTGLYLEPATGEQPGSILDMAREGLRDALAVALRQAAAQDGPAVRHNVLVKSNGDWARIDLTVWKITSPESLAGLLLISFMPSAPKKRPHERKTSTNPDAERVIDLEQELQYSKESLQTTVEELETSNEELKSTNEELASTNEELQSTNEELETSKEEMQSLNEELTTVNNELQSKVEELAEANSDIQNLLDSTDIATVFLDENLCIKRYTQKAKDVVKVIQSDVGRPIGDLAVALEDGENIEELSRKVLDNLQETAKEVRSKDGQWYLMRVRPYRTTQNVIDGVTVIFLPIDRFKRRENEIRSQWDFYESIFDTMRDPVLVLDAHLTVVCANDRFYTVFQYGRKSMEGKKVYDIAKGQWNASGLRKLLEEVLPADHAFEDFELEADFGKAGHRKLVLNGRKLDPSAGRPGMIVLAMEDVTPETYYP